MDPRPVLLYFHYPHEKDDEVTPEGKISKKQCVSILDDAVSRWCVLYRCYEIDMSRSDRRTAERLGAGTGTSFSVVNGKLEVVARSGPLATVKAVTTFLGDALRKGSPEYWAGLEKRIEEQRATLAEARKLAAKRDWAAARARYDEVRNSDLRVADFWEDAVTEGAQADAKAK